MVGFRVDAEVPVPAERAWAVLTDWTAHGRWVPLTAVRITPPGPDAPHGGFVAITTLGPFRLTDPMRVEAADPPRADALHAAPGRCDVVKLGPALRGRAALEVLPLAPDRCRVSWDEEVVPGSRVLAATARPFDPLLAPLARRLFGRALRRAVAEMVGGAPGAVGGP